MYTMYLFFIFYSLNKQQDLTLRFCASCLTTNYNFVTVWNNLWINFFFWLAAAENEDIKKDSIISMDKEVNTETQEEELAEDDEDSVKKFMIDYLQGNVGTK